MSVEPRGKKWVARIRVGGSRYFLGTFGSESAAAACYAQHEASVANGTSPYLLPDSMSLTAYADSIGVRRGTVKRWIGEGLPAHHIGPAVLVVPAEAEPWVREHRTDSVAFSRRAIVYFVERDTDRAIKIGWTSDIARRLLEFRTKQKTDVLLLAAIPGDKPLEQRLQARFAADHIEREWFRPSAELTDFIASIGAVAA